MTQADVKYAATEGGVPSVANSSAISPLDPSHFI